MYWVKPGWKTTTCVNQSPPSKSTMGWNNAWNGSRVFIDLVVVVLQDMFIAEVYLSSLSFEKWGVFLCLFFCAALAFGIYNQRYFGTVSDQIKEKLISEQKKFTSAVKSLDDMIRQCHSCMSTLTFVCTFPSTDDPLEVFFFLCLNCQEVRWCPGVSSLSNSGQPQVSQALL